MPAITIETLQKEYSAYETEQFSIYTRDQNGLPINMADFEYIHWEKFTNGTWAQDLIFANETVYLTMSAAYEGNWRIVYKQKNYPEAYTEFKITLLHVGAPEFTGKVENLSFPEENYITVVLPIRNIIGVGLQFYTSGQWVAKSQGANPSIGTNEVTVQATDPATLADAGKWRATGRGVDGTVVYSNEFEVSITPKATWPESNPITIETQPPGISVVGNEEIKFSITATNVVNYDWQVGIYNQVSGDLEWEPLHLDNISNPVLTPHAKYDHNGTYRCVLSNISESVISETFSVNVDVSNILAITSQPPSIDVEEGQTISVGITASNATSYDWQKETASGWQSLGWPSSEVGNSPNPTTPADAGNYRCIVSDGTEQIISDVFVITIISAPLPVITTQPSATVVYKGEQTQITYAADNEYSVTLQIDSNGTWVDVTSSSGSGGYISTDAIAGDYRVVVSNAAGKTAISDTFKITVLAPIPAYLDDIAFYAYGIPGFGLPGTADGRVIDNAIREISKLSFTAHPLWESKGDQTGINSPYLKTFTAVETSAQKVVNSIVLDQGGPEVELHFDVIPSGVNSTEVLVTFGSSDGKSISKALTINFAPL